MIVRERKGAVVFVLAPAVAGALSGGAVLGVVGALGGLLLGAITGRVIWREWRAPISIAAPDVGVEEVAEPPTPEGRERHLVLLVTAVVLLLAMIAYARLDAMLYSLHAPGDPRFVVLLQAGGRILTSR